MANLTPKNTVLPDKKPKINSVIDEINRGKEYSKKLEQVRCSLETKLEPKDVQYKELYPEFYVERCIVPEYKPDYGECRHVKRNVINRDVLDMKQHINLLAQPKFVKQSFLFVNKSNYSICL